MGRKILFITTDQQRHDALGCTGGRIARTPVVDALAARGLVYERVHSQNVVCMPARSTMLTGQYVRTHGVWMNGVPLPESSPSIAAHLKEQAGYHTQGEYREDCFGDEEAADEGHDRTAFGDQRCEAVARDLQQPDGRYPPAFEDPVGHGQG